MFRPALTRVRVQTPSRVHARTSPSPRREIARIALPVSAEFVLTLVLNLVNQVVVGTLGATAIAAVGFANSLTMILVLTLGALGASVSILVARAYGGGDQRRLDRTASAALVLAGGVSTVAVLPILFCSGPLMRLVGASETVATAGSGYLAFAALAVVPIIVGALLSGILRSTGRPRSPMVATMATVGVNAVLAYLLVTGTGPFPQLGAAGAGVATLITATLKAVILAVQVYGRHRVVAWDLPRGYASWRQVVTPLVLLAVPLGITELFWTVGTFLYNVVFQQISDEALAAAQIVTLLESVFLVGSLGLMSATTALVGREVGRGNADAAVAWVRRIKRAGTWTGVGFGVLYGATALLLPVLFPDSGVDVRTMAVVGILLYAVSQVVKVRNMILGAGVLPSANDVRGVIMGDVTGAFVVGLPLAVLLGLHTPLGVAGIFLARVVEEVAKVGIFTRRVRHVHWHELAGQPAPSRGSAPATKVVPDAPAREVVELEQLA